MTRKAISPLRQRMIDDMTVRRMASHTQQGYIRAVKRFADFFGRSPDKATAEDVRCFHVHLAKTIDQIPTMNATMTALKFFFGVTLGRRDVVEGIPFAREPRKLPVILSPDEVARLLAATANIKCRTALSLAYATGLRASEVVSLKITDIDSKRMVVRVEQGKGSKDRYVMLSPCLPRVAAAMVEGVGAGGLAISQLPRSAHVGAPAPPDLSGDGEAGGDQEARITAYVAPQLCDASP